jgi:hypothetical protein
MDDEKYEFHVKVSNNDNICKFLMDQCKSSADSNIDLAPLEFDVWKWENECLANIHISLSSQTSGLYVDFQKRWGDNSLYRQFYRDVIKAGNTKGIFCCPVPEIHALNCHVREDDIPEEISPDTFKILFDMCESEYEDTKVSGGKAIIALYSNTDGAIDYLNSSERTIPAISSMLKIVPKNPSVINVECVTIGLVILDRLCGESSFTFQKEALKVIEKVSWLSGKEDAMWAEARRRLSGIETKLNINSF